MQKKLYKSAVNKKISGVCGGIAEYLSVDATIIRLLWIIFCLLGGSGVLAYIICIVVIPEGSAVRNETPSDDDDPRAN